MVEVVVGGDEANGRLPIETLPKSALQALYHAVTGKTERYSKRLDGNVIIRNPNIDNLFHALCQQIEHYKCLADCTVTVEVQTADNKKYQYSSWERYCGIRLNTLDVTSEISIKIEFIAELPNTNTPQRCVLNVNMDSSLPLLIDEERRRDLESIPFIFMLNRNWHTVKIDIDFVDFLIAKNFTNIIEEWFKHLDKSPRSKLNDFLIRHGGLFTSISSNVARAGAGFFIATYVWFSGSSLGDTTTLAYGVSLILVIWASFNVLRSIASRHVRKRLNANVVPSAILLTEGDNKAYRAVTDKVNSAASTAIRMVALIIFNVTLNIIASYIFVSVYGGS